MKISFSIILFLVGFLFFVNFPVFSQTDSLGIFEGHTDIGKVMYAGSAKYKAEPEEYEIQSPANDTQKNEEGFHFVWKRIKGDFIFYAQVNLPEKDSNFSGIAGCMVRTILNENSANINSSIDERGHTDIKFRRNGGESIGEIESSLKEANIIQIERSENTYTISIAKFGEPFVIKQVKDLDLGDEVYVGLFTASANQSRVERGIYSNVRFTIPVPKVLSLFRTDIGSNLEVLDIETGNRKILLVDSNSVHSPIWKKDGETLIYAKQGFLYTFNLTNKICQLLNTGVKKSNSNDHVLSFDGKMLSFCVPTEEKGGPIVYTVPVTGGEPKQINKTAPSYPHSWSPDGKTLLLSASRKGEFEIYKIASSGGKEYGITNSLGMDDCPEYTPDGKQIYFNSNRTGTMRIWRMNADGSEPEVVTTGEYYDWFPHISPDGKWMVFLSYSKEDASASGHPSYRKVYLRLMPVSGGQPKIIAYLYGGQGSINSPCWSPDSKKIAFASYSDTQY
jgi:TolB protein